MKFQKDKKRKSQVNFMFENINKKTSYKYKKSRMDQGGKIQLKQQAETQVRTQTKQEQQEKSAINDQNSTLQDNNDLSESKDKEKKKKKKDKKKDKKQKKQESNEQGKEQKSQNIGQNAVVTQEKGQRAIQAQLQVNGSEQVPTLRIQQQTQIVVQQGQTNQNQQALKAVQSISEAATQQVNDQEKRIQTQLNASNSQQQSQSEQKIQQKPTDPSLNSQSNNSNNKQISQKNIKKKSSAAGNTSAITGKQEKSKKSNKDKEELAELQLLLKEKLKQIKTLSSKNSKLQAKYVDLFKQNKAVKKESSYIIQCIVGLVERLGQNSIFGGQIQKSDIDPDYLKQSINEIIGIVKNPSFVKEQLINKWRQAISMKIAIQLKTKQTDYGKKIEEIYKEHQKVVQSQTSKHNSALEELKKQFSLIEEKLKQSLTQLQQELQSAKAKHSKEINTLTLSHTQAITQLKEDLKKELLKSSSNQLQQLSSIHQQQLKALYEQLQIAKQKNKDDQETIKEIDQKLDNKNSQVSRLMKQKLKLEHQINQLKMKTFRQELQETQTYERKQQESINERNEFLKIRQELQAMIQKRDHLKGDITKLQREVSKHKETIKIKDNEIQQLLKQLTVLQRERNQSFGGHIHSKQVSAQYQHNSSRPEPQPQVPGKIQIKSSSQQIPHPSNQPRKSSKTVQQRQTLQQQRQEYLRNVFIRYIKSILTENQSSQTLLRVILTILKVPERDKKQLQHLLNSKKKWWIF